MSTFPLMALSRLRISTDGFGITSLVAAWGCPLRCRLCLNPACLNPSTPVRHVSAEELYASLKIDDLYFQATGGGVCFGGGEPLLHADFIAEFRMLCGNRWRITAETSLNIPTEQLAIDVKDMNPEIYARYTGSDLHLVRENLLLLKQIAAPKRIKLRVPLIPYFNTSADVARSITTLQNMDFEQFDRFRYVEPTQNSRPKR